MRDSDGKFEHLPTRRCRIEIHIVMQLRIPGACIIEQTDPGGCGVIRKAAAYPVQGVTDAGRVTRDQCDHAKHGNVLVPGKPQSEVPQIERPRGILEQARHAFERQRRVGFVEYPGLQSRAAQQQGSIAAVRTYELCKAHQRPRPDQHLLLAAHVTKSLPLVTK